MTPPRRNLWQRVVALADAGMSTKEIALEIGAGPQYVACTLRRRGYVLVRRWVKS